LKMGHDLDTDLTRLAVWRMHSHTGLVEALRLHRPADPDEADPG
jgi:hypothetical protein